MRVSVRDLGKLVVKHEMMERGTINDLPSILTVSEQKFSTASFSFASLTWNVPVLMDHKAYGDCRVGDS